MSDVTTKIKDPSSARGILLLRVAVEALRSYAHGNASPDLAREILEKIDQADPFEDVTGAIGYVLIRIKMAPSLPHEMGPGTQTFHLLTAAFAELQGEDVGAVRNRIVAGAADVKPRETPDY